MPIYLSLGSNVGDRVHNLNLALSNFIVLKQSSFYETEPVDFLDQPWFINLAVEIDTTLSPMELLHFGQTLEKRMGSVKEILKGPRLIDIDILFYDDQVVNNPKLTIPHPRIAFRRFVLDPMNEIAPEFVHPELGKTIVELLRDCPDQSTVKKL